MATDNARDLLEIIGPCGKFQVAITAAADFAMIAASWGMLLMVFGMYNPGWTCDDVVKASLTFSNYTKEHNDASTNWTLECSSYKNCTDVVYNDGSSTVVTEWSLSCDMAWVPSLIITIEMLGVILGSYVSGQVGDKFGRKVAIYGNLAIIAIFYLLAISSVSWQMYATILFVIGFGVGGVITTAYPLPYEFLTERWRGVVASIPVWNVGTTTFAVAVFVLRDWRYVHIAASVFSAIAFLGVFWTPESARWLAVSGKTEAAKNVIEKIARMNGRVCPDTRIIDKIADEEKTRMDGHKYTYLDLFRIKAVRALSIKFGISYCILAISYYAISFGIKSLAGDFYVNFIIFGIIEIPGMMLVGPSVNKLGRRTAALLCSVFEGLLAFSVVIITFAASGETRDMGILVLALGFKMLNAATWAITSVFVLESIPTVLRTIFHGYLNGLCRLGIIISPYLIPREPGNLFIAFSVLGCLKVVNFWVTWTLAESKGRPLADVAIANDGEADDNESESQPLPDAEQDV